MKQAAATVLMVEDNPGDVELFRESLGTHSRVELAVAPDGVAALDMLTGDDALKPDLIVLDLNLPRRHGKSVLREIKSDPALKLIPIVILTSSSAPSDVQKCYDLGANCYIAKPDGLEQFEHMVRELETFWLSIARLPSVH